MDHRNAEMNADAAAWLANRGIGSIRTTVPQDNHPSTSGRLHPPLEGLYSQAHGAPAGNRDIMDLLRLVRPGSPTSPVIKQDSGSPTQMLLNLLGIMPSTAGGAGAGDLQTALKMNHDPSPLRPADIMGQRTPVSSSGLDLNNMRQISDWLQRQADGGVGSSAGALSESAMIDQLLQMSGGPQGITNQGSFWQHNQDTDNLISNVDVALSRHRSKTFDTLLGMGSQRMGGGGTYGSDALAASIHAHQQRLAEQPRGFSAGYGTQLTAQEMLQALQPSAAASPKFSPVKGHKPSDDFELSATEKKLLMSLAAKYNPAGMTDWSLLATALGKTNEDGPAIERKYREILAESAPAPPTPQPRQKNTASCRDAEVMNKTNKHGRRINPRKGIPMHVMATYALLRLPQHEGNLSDMAAKIEENAFFSKQLDWTPRPGTKTYPRWKDALVGCFKSGRYPHLKKTARKKEGLTMYALLDDRIPDKSCLKPAMLVDVDPADLPQDFDPQNPLVPLDVGSARDGAEMKRMPSCTVTTGSVDRSNTGSGHGGALHVGGEVDGDGQHKHLLSKDLLSMLPLPAELNVSEAHKMNSLLPSISNLLPGPSLQGIDSNALEAMPSNVMQLLGTSRP